MSGARALPTRTVEKPWGRDRLPPPFQGPPGKRIGEIWFEPPPEVDALLVKYLFTGEKLSVQVHPDDEQAPAGVRGKDECWLIVDAEPGAQIAIGFEEPIGAEAMRASALDGSIEQLLSWRAVEPGDFFYLPAGTVHAIGAGLALIEIQRNSDITYRLYDYGRPRELHLDEAIAVAQGRPYDPQFRRRVSGRLTQQLVEGHHFRVHHLSGTPDAEVIELHEGAPLLIVPIGAPVQIAATRIEPGQCGFAPTLSEVVVPEDGRALLAQSVRSEQQG